VIADENDRDPVRHDVKADVPLDHRRFVADDHSVRQEVASLPSDETADALDLVSPALAATLADRRIDRGVNRVGRDTLPAQYARGTPGRGDYADSFHLGDQLGNERRLSCPGITAQGLLIFPLFDAVEEGGQSILLLAR
jgi:hypothetical protein